MAATVAGQQNTAEYMLADAVLGFSAEKSDSCLIPEALEAALKTVLHIGISLPLVATVFAKEV